MRLSELLHAPVVDAHGVDLGRVDDVRLVQDGPLIDGFGAALRVAGIVAGPGGLAVRLGYVRHGVRGPALIRRLATWAERRTISIDWDQVASWDGDRVVLAVPREDLRTPGVTAVAPG